MSLVSSKTDTYVSIIDDTGVLEMLDHDADALSPFINADQVAIIARAIGHPARVRIIAFLLAKPGCIGGDIVDQVGLAQSTISEHLRILKEAGIVTGTIDYPRVCYALDPSALVPLRDLLEAVAARVPDGDAPCWYTPDGCAPEETVR
jgi:DNA-binding transcriptional ArsR family regulator